MSKHLRALWSVFLALALFASFSAFAAVDVNQGTRAELEGVKGVGPSLAGKILDQRGKAPFKDWSDLIGRVHGLGEKSAARLSAEGLTVGGASYKNTVPAIAPNTSGIVIRKTPRAASSVPVR